MWTRWSNLCVKLNCFLNLKYLLTRWLFCKMYLSQFKKFTKCKPGETIYGGKKDVCWSNHKRASAANGCEYLVSIEHFCLLCLWFSKISITTFYFLPWIKRTSWIKANLANKTVTDNWVLKYWISKTGWSGVSISGLRQIIGTVLTAFPQTLVFGLFCKAVRFKLKLFDFE